MSELPGLSLYSREDIVRSQTADPQLAPIIKWLTEQRCPTKTELITCSEETKILAARFKTLSLQNNLLVRKCPTQNPGDPSLQTILPLSL